MLSSEMIEVFDPIDIALASKGEMSLAVAYLSLAARQGHLCVKEEQGYLQPGLEELGISKSPKTWAKALVQSFQKLKITAHPYAKQVGDAWYLPRFYEVEQGISRELQRLQDANLILQVDVDGLRKDVEDLISEGKLLPKQGELILLSAQNPISLLTGGPGTGKTYTVRWMIDLMIKHLYGGKKIKIALAGPTGKAAANLSLAISDLSRSLVSISTLHRLLRMMPGRPYQQTSIDADLIVVDECSMIDAQMFYYLLGAIKNGARLLLVGDPHQLPSVEAGAIFSDIVKMEKAFPHMHLVECRRAELASLVNLAEAVHQGDSEKVVSMCGQPGIEMMSMSSKTSRQMQEEVVEVLSHPYFNEDTSPKEILEHFKNTVLLTPLRQGPLGVEVLNALCVERYGSRIAPIMITRNDDKNALSNGDVGVLMRRGGELKRGDYAYFLDATKPEGYRKIPALFLPRYEYAYVLSIHKSQGSEYPHVIVLLPEGAQAFGRSALYTAITRARRKLSLWCCEDVLKATLEFNPQRISGLKNVTGPG